MAHRVGLGVCHWIRSQIVPIAKMIEVSSRSASSFDDAIRQGIDKASETVDNVQSAWVKDQEVLLENGQVNEYQVDLKVTFLVE